MDPIWTIYIICEYVYTGSTCSEVQRTWYTYVLQTGSNNRIRIKRSCGTPCATGRHLWLQHCNCLPWRKPRHVVESKSRYYCKANNQPNKQSSFSTHMAVRTHSEYIAIISLSDYVAICLLGARMLFLLCFLEGMTLT